MAQYPGSLFQARQVLFPNILLKRRKSADQRKTFISARVIHSKKWLVNYTLWIKLSLKHPYTCINNIHFNLSILYLFLIKMDAHTFWLVAFPTSFPIPTHIPFLCWKANFPKTFPLQIFSVTKMFTFHINSLINYSIHHDFQEYTSRTGSLLKNHM